MADKESDKKILIDGITVAYATSVKASPETNSSSTNTFDGAITQGMDKVAWNVELEKVRYDSQMKHRELSQLLDEMLSNPKMVTVIEKVHTPEESYIVKDNFFGCLLDGNDYEIKADDLTTESIKFKASSRKREYPNE